MPRIGKLCKLVMLYSYCSEYMLQCTVSFTIIYTVVEINLE